MRAAEQPAPGQRFGRRRATGCEHRVAGPAQPQVVQLDLVIVVPIARAVAAARSAERAGARTEPSDTAAELIVTHLPRGKRYGSPGATWKM